MPAVSKDQRVAMAIAEHNPDQLNSANKGMLKMTKSQLHDFASTKETGLPKRVTKLSSGKRGGGKTLRGKR